MLVSLSNARFGTFYRFVTLFMTFNARIFWVGLLAIESYSMAADEWQVITTKKKSTFRRTIFVDSDINVLQIFKWYFFFLLWRCDPTRAMATSFLRFLDHTQRRTTVDRTPLGEWSARRRDNTQHSQQTYIHAPGGIRIHDLSMRAVADLRIRPRGHWDRLKWYLF